jgi:hypothetical protein
MLAAGSCLLLSWFGSLRAARRASGNQETASSNADAVGIPPLPQDVFTMLLKKIYKRQK